MGQPVRAAPFSTATDSEGGLTLRTAVSISLPLTRHSLSRRAHQSFSIQNRFAILIDTGGLHSHFFLFGIDVNDLYSSL